MSEREARLRRELEAAFAARAQLYVHLRYTLAAELGADRADALLARALEAWGRETGARIFAAVPPDPHAVADAFLALSPDEGALFPHVRDDTAEGACIAVRRCPLQDAWHADGLEPEEIAALCRLAGAFDKGCFEAAGVGFANLTWGPGKEGCCVLHLSRRRSDAE